MTHKWHEVADVLAAAMSHSDRGVCTLTDNEHAALAMYVEAHRPDIHGVLASPKRLRARSGGRVGGASSGVREHPTPQSVVAAGTRHIPRAPAADVVPLRQPPSRSAIREEAVSGQAYRRVETTDGASAPSRHGPEAARPPLPGVLTHSARGLRGGGGISRP